MSATRALQAGTRGCGRPRRAGAEGPDGSGLLTLGDSSVQTAPTDPDRLDDHGDDQGASDRKSDSKACEVFLAAEPRTVRWSRSIDPWQVQPLQVRWDRDAGRWFAFVLLACAVVCFNRL